MELEQQPGDFADLDQIACPVCTFFNAVTNTHCEICGESLNQA